MRWNSGTDPGWHSGFSSVRLELWSLVTAVDRGVLVLWTGLLRGCDGRGLESVDAVDFGLLTLWTTTLL